MNWNKGGPGTKRGFGFGGFAISAGKKEEPKLPQQSHSAFGATSSSSGFGKSAPPQLPSFYKIGSKRANFDEENAYFEDEEEDSSNVDLPYIPAENSPTRQQFHSKLADSDSDDDPLEAFMAEVEDQAARDMKRLEEKDKERKNVKGIRDDIEEEDDQEAYFRYMAENPTAGVVQEEEEDNLEYDSDGNPIAPSKKIIDPLPPIDHSEIDYPPFEKNFYNEHEEITNLTPQQLIDLRHKLNLRVSGAAPPRPGSSFAHFGFDEQLMHQIRKSEYTQPTPIQCQTLKILRIGRTGRAGEKGVAYTLLTPKDSNFAGDLVRNLEGANQHVSKELLDLAMQNAWFRKSRFKGGKGKKLNIGGGGLGYRERPGLGSENTDRGNNNNVMSNYEAYKPSTGAMGDRLTAMKAAFQSQYKSHFVAASLSNQKAGSSAAGASGWTSAGSLNSVPTSSAQQGHSSPDSPIASATKGIPSFGNTGNLSSAPVTYPSAGAQGVNNTASGSNSREGPGGGNGKRERYTENRGGSRHGHGESSSRHGDSPRHGDGGRHGDGYRYPESSGSRHADSHRHGENRHGGSGSRHGESRGANDGRNGESRKEGCNRESKVDPKVDSKMDKVDSKTDKTADGFAVPEPPKRKKSRWDS